MASLTSRQSPDLWSFREGAGLSVALVLFGIVLEVVAGGKGVPFPSWPMNLVILLLLVVNIVLAGLLLRENPFVRWLGGIPLGLCLILTMAALSLVGGLLPQTKGAGPGWAGVTGLDSVFSSWPFGLTVLFFLVNLGLSLVWKTVPFKLSNLQFVLFHAGFWIALSCGLAGATDLKRVIIPLYEGRSTAQAWSPADKSMNDLPFSLFLKDFEMLEYSPRLALYDQTQDRFIPNKAGVTDDMRQGLEVSWENVEIRVEQYLENAIFKDGRAEPAPAGTKDALPWAYLSGTYAQKTLSGWVSTGSPFMKPFFLEAEDKLIVMLAGSPKKYSSEVTVMLEGIEDGRSAVLEVNKPVSVKGWNLYQMGYDEKAGRWSELSLVEGVKDPWLPMVYLGFFMILAGNTLFFWKGFRKK